MDRCLKSSLLDHIRARSGNPTKINDDRSMTYSCDIVALQQKTNGLEACSGTVVKIGRKK
jgi:hypothetical protein